MIWGGTVWAVTLWTNGRRPYLTGSSAPTGRGPTPWSLVHREWQAVGTRIPAIVLGDIVVLPDRLRALLYLAAGVSTDILRPALAGFMARSDSRLGGRAGKLWDPAVECVRVESPFELILWQRRLRASAPGLSRAPPAA